VKNNNHILLFLLSLAAIALLAVSRSYFSEEHPVKNADLMRRASRLSEYWMEIIQQDKAQRHLLSAEARHFPSEGLIGDDFSEMTTTLGSLDAKQISVNPQFAAVVVGWITALDLDSTDVVLVTSSGSFPGLAVSTLAALQTMNQRAVLVTSVGASSYGANQPAMTIIDIELLLMKKGGMRYRSELITYGCDNDNGEGLYEGGKEAIDASAGRNGLSVWKPAYLHEAVQKRISIAQHHDVKLLINIGGNQAMLGNCSHASSLPNGLHRSLQTCLHEERGAIARISELGIPVVHFLNIKELGLRYGISDSYLSNEGLFSTRIPNAIMALISVVGIFFGVVKLYAKDKYSSR
jgi:poly-gamma-glutamate system protein